MAEKNLKITLVKSPIGAVPKHRATVDSTPALCNKTEKTQDV